MRAHAQAPAVAQAQVVAVQVQALVRTEASRVLQPRRLAEVAPPREVPRLWSARAAAVSQPAVEVAQQAWPSWDCHHPSQSRYQGCGEREHRTDWT